MPKITKGMANSLNGTRECSGCHMRIPVYPGRYPARCPECCGDITVSVNEILLQAMDEGKSASEAVDEFINEVLWSGDVVTKAKPPAELFSKGSASAIAKWALNSHGNDKRRAMASLNFYINRAGKNLAPKIKTKIEAAKKKVSAA